jgi:hypothetical protein
MPPVSRVDGMAPVGSRRPDRPCFDIRVRTDSQFGRAPLRQPERGGLDHSHRRRSAAQGDLAGPGGREPQGGPVLRDGPAHAVQGRGGLLRLSGRSRAGHRQSDGQQSDYRQSDGRPDLAGRPCRRLPTGSRLGARSDPRRRLEAGVAPSGRVERRGDYQPAAPHRRRGRPAAVPDRRRPGGDRSRTDRSTHVPAVIPAGKASRRTRRRGGVGTHPSSGGGPSAHGSTVRQPLPCAGGG